MSEISFEACFRLHARRLIALGVTMSSDAELASDLTQETFLRLHRQWDDLHDHDDIGRWLTRVMANLLIDHHRSKTAEQRAVTQHASRAASLPRAGEPPTADWASLVAGLPPRQRVIVTLHYGEDLPVAEIAGIIGVSVNTVKSALSKARNALRHEGGTNER